MRAKGEFLSLTKFCISAVKVRPSAQWQWRPKGAKFGHISVCIHLTNTTAHQEINCVLSWQSSKHSRDVLSGFVFPVFTKRLERSRSEAQDPGLHNGTSEKFGAEHTHTDI